MEITRKELQTNRVKPDPDDSASTVARNQVSQDFERETRILRLLGSTQNPNIVNILGSYVLKNVYNILLPRASTDLEELLRGKYLDIPTDESEFFERLCGLAYALDSMHCFRNVEQGLDMLGCHLDLKPNNILIFGRTWKLADFGLSRLVPVDQGSRTSFKDCIGDYLAPECMDNDFSQQKIGRKSDIWSLGCIICDVLTFSAWGPKGVAEFRTRRRTQTRPGVVDSGFHFQGRLKPEVEKWLAGLNISRAMIALVRHMLDECPDNRPDIRTVWVNLMFITLNSIANQTQRQLTDICNQPENWELRLECVRFKKWCKALDLVSPSGLQLNPGHEQIIDAYPNLLIQIRSMHDRLAEFTSTPRIADLGTVGKHELYMEIREYNDCLWTELPSPPSTLSTEFRPH